MVSGAVRYSKAAVDLIAPPAALPAPPGYVVSIHDIWEDDLGYLFYYYTGHI